MTPDPFAEDVDAVLDGMDPDRDVGIALHYPCTFCGAEPGKPCIKTDGSGWVLLLPHYSRTPGRTL